MKLHFILPALLCLLFCSYQSLAQEVNEEEYEEEEYEDVTEDEYYEEAEDLSEDLVRNSEFHIPSTPVFSLLGVTPEMVSRPAIVQDFKVDWRIKNYNLAPDLSIELQPLWAFYYDRKGLDAYRKASPFMQALSTLSLSLGTAKIDGFNHLSYAGKINLYRERDHISDAEMYKEMADELKELERPIKERMDDIRNELDTVQSRENKIVLKDALFQARYDLQEVRRSQKIKLIEVQAGYLAENWNASMLDVGLGRVHTYNNGLDTIQKAGWSFWVNGALRSGRRGLITSIIRTKSIGTNTDLMLGAGYHFGGARFNFYSELVFESLRNIADLGFADTESLQDVYSEDLGIGWVQFEESLEAVNRWTISYGGNFRLSNGIMLNFSLRTLLSEQFKFSKFIPVANVTCLMR